MELPRPHLHIGSGIDHRRRRLRQPEQPQRLELDLPVEAYDPDMCKGDTRPDPDWLPAVQRSISHHCAGN